MNSRLTFDLSYITRSKMAAPKEKDTTNLENVKHIILVLSGKGGVGKSTVSTQLVLGLRNAGKKVGILDVDLCGPSIPKMLGVESHEIHQCSEGWVPVYPDKDQQIAVMSIGFLLSKSDEAVVWRGPKKNAMIKQFLTDVYWQNLDYLVIDTPPGTSDEHLAVIENIKEHNPDGAILVTTPQAVAVGDVRRELTFCKKTGICVLGIIENMSGYVCPHCSECTNIFSKGGGEALAKQFSVPFLGCIPLDPNLAKSLEDGTNLINIDQTQTSSNTSAAIDSIVQQIVSKTDTLTHE